MTCITEDKIIFSKQAWLDQRPKEKFIQDWNRIMSLPETSNELKALDPEEVFKLLSDDYYEKYLANHLASLIIKGEAN